MKRTLAVLVVLAFVFALAGCAGNGGNEQVQVPDVYNFKIDEAESALTALGFSVTRVMQPSKAVAAGRVMSTNPYAGAKCDRGTEIKVFEAVHDGEPPTYYVPNVVGLTEEDAREAFFSAGLGAEVEYKEDSAPKGTVTRQSMVAGTRGESGVIVTLTVSAGSNS